ncbi:MAG: methyltransferase domain-containing protein [Burkholderiales bacterium]|nr:methyltransferase domain-containing protein [Burkholderiales bacterium]
MGTWPGNRSKPDRSVSLEQYRLRARIYDTELAAFEPIRTAAVDKLDLQPGQWVLDVGCGTGLSFGLLEDGVGPRGRITGIDQCPEMLAQARERVKEHHWRNVELVEKPAASAVVKGRADAVLFHFTHDILRDAGGIGRIVAHLKPGARVAAAGLQWAPPWMLPTNAFVLLAAMHSVTSFEGLSSPWDLLAVHLDGLHVDTTMLGGVYVASGRVKH